MSGGRAKRSKKKSWRSTYRHASLNRKLEFCLNCGERGAHFVPPSFGDPGFYMCKPSS